ncbi:hypothetical protein ACH3XW_37550 [Acanthocheilonema viteae]
MLIFAKFFLSQCMLYRFNNNYYRLFCARLRLTHRIVIICCNERRGVMKLLEMSDRTYKTLVGERVRGHSRMHKCREIKRWNLFH